MAAHTRFREAIVPGLLWLWLFWHLHDEWSLNAQYNYGWAVPFLGCFLFYLRWLDRPVPESAGRDVATSVIGWFLLALLLPVRMIEEANPDWRLLSWVFALVVVGYSLLVLKRVGGRAWANHFVFPVCFPLVAVPWLVQFENAVVQQLTGTVAYAAVEIAGWIGVGAYQLGNVIELHNGFVGVDEACSGVKTLQAAIMVTLLLGELLLLPVGRRVILVLAGCIWVFAGNVLRATALVLIAANQGTEALTRWHDTIGTVVVVVGMGGLVAIAWFLRLEKGDRRSEPRINPPYRLPGSTAGIFLRLSWLALIFAGTEIWYRSHERELLALPAWQVHWPTDVAGLQAAPLADSTRAILRYNRASSAAWEHPDGVHWWSFFARWEPQRTALQLVRSHSPEICLPAVGRIFRGERPLVLVENAVVPLRFRAYEFEQNGRALFVFVCVQEDKIAPGANHVSPNNWNARGRLLAAWRGQRNLGQRLLEIAVIGFDDFGRASVSFAETVRAMIEPSASTG